MRVGFLHSLLRKDDKLLLTELQRRRQVEVVAIDDRQLTAELGAATLPRTDVVLVRSISFSRALHAVKLLEAEGASCVNRAAVAECCGSKLETSIALSRNGVPQPRVRIALSADAALKAMDEIGYPVVLKPVVGSWGRLICRINDHDAAEAILEHRSSLGTAHANIFYMQELIDKPGRDIRAFVIGDRCLAAIYRSSPHWITNTARGATVTACPLSSRLEELAAAAAQAVGGGILAVDLLESNGDLLVNEVNHTMEFKNSIEPTGVDIPGHIVDHVLAIGRGETEGVSDG